MANPATVHPAEATVEGQPLEIDLKDPVLAALLAWLVPGLGHWYQGRRHKAVLFFVCILGTFMYGLYLGEGRVVYASWRPNDKRLQYFTQVAVGLPALPAAVQALRAKPIQFPVYKDFMVPPKLVPEPGESQSELDRLVKRLHRYWELGTYFTVIAGLLNILAIYDAWGGPAFSAPPPPPKKQDDDEASGEATDDDAKTA
ncbi:MAG TPA: DUF6677 family protein [Pirellulales bacterium]|nr:DUF6677 family protein [Pirellulales bacterium]